MSKGHNNAVRVLPQGGSSTAPAKSLGPTGPQGQPGPVGAKGPTGPASPATPPPLILCSAEDDWTAKHAEFFWLMTRMVAERKVTTDVAAQVAASLLRN